VPAGARLLVKRRVMAKDALLVERQTPLGSKILGNPLTGCHTRAKLRYATMPSCMSCHRVGKGVAQPGNDLEQGQIGVREPATNQVCRTMRISRKHALEIADEFR